MKIGYHAVPCLVCGKPIEISDLSCSHIRICDECKEAIAFAKKHMKEENTK